MIILLSFVLNLKITWFNFDFFFKKFFLCKGSGCLFGPGPDAEKKNVVGTIRAPFQVIEWNQLIIAWKCIKKSHYHWRQHQFRKGKAWNVITYVTLAKWFEPHSLALRPGHRLKCVPANSPFLSTFKTKASFSSQTSSVEADLSALFSF